MTVIFHSKKFFFRIIVRNTNEAGEEDNQYIFARFSSFMVY